MELVSKPNVTAAVWEHLGFKPNDRGDPVNLCKPVYRICCKTVATERASTIKKKIQQIMGHLHLPDSPQSLARLVDKQSTNRTVQMVRTHRQLYFACSFYFNSIYCFWFCLCIFCYNRLDRFYLLFLVILFIYLNCLPVPVLNIL